MKKLVLVWMLSLGACWSTAQATDEAAWSGDLSPIGAADWNREKARHLLERAGFGGTPEEVDALAALSPQAAVRRLVYFEGAPADTLPVAQVG